jgi:hypothetical protein
MSITRILLLFLSISITNITYGQSANMPSLSKIMAWTDMTLEKFDSDARASGYRFEAKNGNASSTLYTYSREIIFNKLSYTERLVYKVLNTDKSTIIQLVGVSDLLTFYSPQYQVNGFKVMDCVNPPKEGEASFCYENQKYKLYMRDTKIANTDAHQYSAVLVKK